MPRGAQRAGRSIVSEEGLRHHFTPEQLEDRTLLSVVTIDTDTVLTITGAGPDPTKITGVPYTASLVGGVATFKILGDFDIHAGDVVNGTGTHPASILVGNNVDIDPTATFSFSALLTTPQARAAGVVAPVAPVMLAGTEIAMAGAQGRAQGGMGGRPGPAEASPRARTEPPAAHRQWIPAVQFSGKGGATRLGWSEWNRRLQLHRQHRNRWSTADRWFGQRPSRSRDRTVAAPVVRGVPETRPQEPLLNNGSDRLGRLPPGHSTDGGLGP